MPSSPRVTSFAALPLVLKLASAISLDINDTNSILSVASTLAYGVQTYYTNNASDTPTVDIGVLNSPYYWWQSGAMWGDMIDYWAYTKDTSYLSNTQQGLIANAGPNVDFLPPYYYSSEGNDDVAFWSFSAMTAVEYGFPVPSPNSSTVWLELAQNVFEGEVSRWNTTQCAGGLKWQIYPSEAGYDYKNSIANAGMLQLSARLARYTGNQTYADWAEKVWDWMTAIGLIDSDFNVYDGTDDTINCTQIDHDQWSYSPSALLYGTTAMYNFTGGAAVWEQRSNGLLASINQTFFQAHDNATNIASELCEAGGCDTDQWSFKSYLARWLAKSTVMMPSLMPAVRTLLQTSAVAAAQACSGGDNQQTCGAKWYIGGYDGNPGFGQELSAMSTVQSLLLLENPIVPLTA